MGNGNLPLEVPQDSMNSQPEHAQPVDKRARQSAADYFATGISTGTAIGVALGAAFDDMGMSLALGSRPRRRAPCGRQHG